MKRVFSFLLTAVLLLSLIPAGVLDLSLTAEAVAVVIPNYAYKRPTVTTQAVNVRPNIDGKLDDATWKQATKLPFTQDSLQGGDGQLWSYPEAGTATGFTELPPDGNGDFYLGWDAEYIYFALQIEDEEHQNGRVQGFDLWREDCLQLQIGHSQQSMFDDSARFELGFAYNNKQDRQLGYRWETNETGEFLRAGSTADMSASAGADFYYYVGRDDDTYTTTYEIALKHSWLGGDGLQQGDKFMFGFFLHLHEEELPPACLADPDAYNGYFMEWAQGLVTGKTLGDAGIITCGGCAKHVYDNGCDTVCNACGAAREAIHTAVTDEAVAPTCTETGLTAGSHCAVCGTVLVAQETVPVAAHTYDSTNDVDCAVCGDVRYLTYTVIDGNVTITAVDTSLRGELVIPAVIEGCPVTMIGSEAFYGCTRLTGVTLPTGVTVIEDYAFEGCRSLLTVNLPNTLLSIGEGAFDGCRAIASLTIPASVETLGSYAFYNCYALTTLYLGVGVREIGMWAFGNCTLLADVYYDDFASARENITVASGNDCLNNATWHCVVCEHVYDNTCDTDCNVCGAVRETEHTYDNVCDAACNVCGAQRPITHHYTDANDNVCDLCGDDRTLAYYSYTVTDGKATITAVDTAISGDVIVPATLGGYPVVAIGEGAFQRCNSITSLVLPTGLQRIGIDAFYRCSAMTTVSLPTTVTEIDEAAFYGCAAIADVYYDGTAADFAKVTVGMDNERLTDAAWHYAGCEHANTVVNGKVDATCTTKGFSGNTVCADCGAVLVVGEAIPAGHVWGDDTVCDVCGYTVVSSAANDFFTIDVKDNGDSTMDIVVYYHTDKNLSNGIFEINFTADALALDAMPKSDLKYHEININDRQNGNILIGFMNPATQEDIDIGWEPEDVLFPKTGRVIQLTMRIKDTSLTTGSVTVSTRELVTLGEVWSVDIAPLLTAEFALGGSAHTHSYDDNCDADCNVCGEVRTVVHGELLDAAVAPTCTQTGLTLGAHCGICGIVLVEQEIVPAMGHQYGDDTVCDVCGDDAALPYYTYTVTDGKVTITDVDTSISGKITIPATIEGYPVVAIGNNAFRDCVNMTSVTIPESVETIGQYAFKDCTALTTVYYNAENCTSAGVNAYPVFHGCTALITVYVGKSVESVPQRLFRQATALTTVYLTKNTKTIGANAFYLCDAITDVYFVGTAGDWTLVDVKSYNTALTDATFAYNTPCFQEHDWTADCDSLCDLCGTKRATTHANIVDDAAVAPTCDATGLTAGSHCATCGNVIEAQKIVPALGHTWDAGKVLVEPTEEADGEKLYTCTVCGGTKIVPLNLGEIIDGYYYYKGVLKPGAGLVQVEDALYYITSTGAVKTGRYMLSASEEFGIERGAYYFFEDGKLNLERGVYEGLYYNDKGIGEAYAGLIEWNGAKYYVNDGGKVMTGRYFITKLNDLVPKKRAYTFYEDGKMLEETRIYDVDGFYYENGIRVPYAGMVMYEGHWYYVSDHGAYVKNKQQILVNVNNSGLAKSARCYFDENGHLVTNAVVNGKYYGEDGAAPSYAGVVKAADGNLYYVSGTNGTLTVGKTFTVSAAKTNGLCAAGKYTADANGVLTPAS